MSDTQEVKFTISSIGKKKISSHEKKQKNTTRRKIKQLNITEKWRRVYLF